MKQTKAILFVLVVLASAIAQEVTIGTQRGHCIGSPTTATVTFQTVEAKDGSSYIRNFIKDCSFGGFNATDLSSETFSDCVKNASLTNVNAFTFRNETCLGYDVWSSVPSRFTVAENETNGLTVYFAATQPAQYQDINTTVPASFKNSSIGAFHLSTENILGTAADSYCSALCSELFTPNTDDEVQVLFDENSMEIGETFPWLNSSKLPDSDATKCGAISPSGDVVHDSCSLRSTVSCFIRW